MDPMIVLFSLPTRPTCDSIVATSDAKMCYLYEKQRRIAYATTSVALSGGTALLAFCKVKGVGRDGIPQAR